MAARLMCAASGRREGGLSRGGGRGARRAARCAVRGAGLKSVRARDISTMMRARDLKLVQARARPVSCIPLGQRRAYDGGLASEKLPFRIRPRAGPLAQWRRRCGIPQSPDGPIMQPVRAGSALGKGAHRKAGGFHRAAPGTSSGRPARAWPGMCEPGGTGQRAGRGRPTASGASAGRCWAAADGGGCVDV